MAAPLTPQAVLDLRSAADAALSPDARQVVYRVDRARREGEPLGGNIGELWSIAAAGSPPQRLADAGLDAREPKWSPDGSRLAWLARSDLAAAPQLQVRMAAGGPVTVLTRATDGVDAFRWSPESGRIAFTALDDEPPEGAEALAAGRDWVVFGEARAQRRLYVVDLGTGAVTRVTSGPLTVHDFDWSPDGLRLVFAGAPSPSADDEQLHSQPFVVDAAGGSARLLAPHVGRLSHPRWSRDGQWIAWLASTALTDPWAGTVYAVSTKSDGTPRALTGGYGGTIVWLGDYPGHPGSLAFVGEERQGTVLYRLDLATGQTVPLARGAEVFGGDPSFSADGRSAAVVASTAAHPDEVFLARLPLHGLRRLTDSNPSLSGVELGSQSIVRWKSVDGLEIEGVLIKPVGFREGVRYPVVLQVHGGSEGISLDGWQASYRNWGQLLAARGYVTLYPNYRGSRGRGVGFVTGNRGDVMGREFEDLVTGLDHLVALGLADPGRAGIFGFSWGGYAAGWAATYGSARFKAAVAASGIYDWVSAAGTSDTRIHEQLVHWDAPLNENFLKYLERSPIHEIRRANTPVLLLHGERDESCPVSQAIEFHTALRSKGVPTELVVYPREGHGLRERAHREDFLTRGLDWLDRYLK